MLLTLNAASPTTQWMSMEAKIFSLKDHKLKKNILLTKQKLMYLSKAELLTQLIEYYEAVKKDPFSLSIALWGEDLMDVISMKALTRELTDLAENHKKNGASSVFKMES